MKRRTLAGALCAALAWLAAPVASADGHPPLWRIDGPSNSIYLLASVHVLRPGDDAMPASVLQAYKQAASIYMEVDVDDMDPAQAGQFTLERGMLPEGQTLHDVLGAERYEHARQQAQQLGLDLEMFAQLEPWVVALSVAQAQFIKLGLDPQAGVEQRLAEKAAQDGKQIHGL